MAQKSGNPEEFYIESLYKRAQAVAGRFDEAERERVFRYVYNKMKVIYDENVLDGMTDSEAADAAWEKLAEEIRSSTLRNKAEGIRPPAAAKRAPERPAQGESFSPLSLLPIVAILTLLWLVLPLLASLWMEEAAYSSFTRVQLQMINPAFCLIIGLITAVVWGYKWYYNLLMPAVFFPYWAIFLKPQQLLYLPIYFMFTLAGLLLGEVLRMLFANHSGR